MKKLLFFITIITIAAAQTAFAEGMVFDPTEYPVIENIPIQKVSSISTPSVEQQQTYRNIENNIKESSTVSRDALSEQNDNFNDALYKLDNAQVNIRNELLEYQTKYQEVDTQYRLIKEQRKVLGDQIKAMQKRINSIEKSKQNIRKTMI